MKAVRYRDIKPSNRTNFLQVYHHACRTLTQIETKLKHAYGDPLPAGAALRLIRLSRKLR